MDTNAGPIELELHDEDAPKTVENFRKLASEGFYDDLILHRVISELLIQGGSPERSDTGGPGAARHRAPRLTVRDGFQQPQGRARRARDGQRRPEYERLAVLHRHRR